MEKETIKKEIIKSIQLPPEKPEEKKLYLFFGLTGSGKSTLAEEIKQRNNQKSIYLAADKISLTYKLDKSEHYNWTFEIFAELLKYYLEQGYSVIADVNADKYEIRKNYYQLAEAKKAEVKTYYLKSSLAEIKARQQQRNELSESELRTAGLYNHSEEEMENYLKELEAPQENEKVYLIDGTFDFAEQLDCWQQVEEQDLFQYLEQIRICLASQVNSEQAKGMASYMRDQFPFYGLQAAERRKALKKFMGQESRPGYKKVETAVKKLWQLPEREFQYFAQELILKYQKEYTKEIIDLFEYMITNKSWWDTVDHIAKKLVGEYFRLFPQKRDEKIKEWLASDNIWLQRTSFTVSVRL